MSATGTVAAVERILAGQKVYSPSEGEQEVFDEARAALLAAAKRAPQASNFGKPVTIVKLAASGHGRTLSTLSFTFEQHELE